SPCWSDGRLRTCPCSPPGRRSWFSCSPLCSGTAETRRLQMERADYRFLLWVVVVTALSIGVSRATALHAQVQASESHLTFEVASIKQHTSDDRRSFGVQPGGRLVERNSTLKNLIAAAFGMAQIQASIPE